MQVTDTNFTLRPYRSEEDYWRIRRFLREVLECNGGHLYSWHVSRFDCWRWSAMERRGADEAMKKLVFLWETSDGHLAAVLHPEDTGHAFLQVHPACRTTELEEAMLSQAERHLTTEKEGRSELTVWAPAHDTVRKDLLRCRGYQKGDDPDYQWRQCLTSAPAPAPLPSGYTLRALRDETEWLALGTASWRAFRPDDPTGFNRGADWYRNIQRAPLYRRDLDLVVVAPNGDIAAFTTVWFDDATRSGMFEPVGTVPEHQRKGLGKAVMLEGLRRLKDMGATTAYVGTHSEIANRLYTSVGFTACDLSERWVKTVEA